MQEFLTPLLQVRCRAKNWKDWRKKRSWGEKVKFSPTVKKSQILTTCKKSQILTSCKNPNNLVPDILILFLFPGRFPSRDNAELINIEKLRPSAFFVLCKYPNMIFSRLKLRACFQFSNAFCLSGVLTLWAE